MFSVIAQNTGLSLKSCETLYNVLIFTIERTLKNDGNINISGFGIFETRYTNVDIHRGLQNMERDAQRKIPVFIPSGEVVAQMNDLEPKPKTALKYDLRRISDSIYGINLKTQSKLGALGYSVQLSRDERWRILIEKAVPMYGKRLVERHILCFIKLKKRDRHRDYKNAIFEWEYDLKRLSEL